MDRFPPTANPRIYTLSTMIIAYLLIDDFTANEQNAIGNWLMTVGQILEANASFQQLMEERVRGNTININSQQFKNGGSPFMNNPPLYPRDDDETGNNNDSSPNTNDQAFGFNQKKAINEDELDTLKKAIDKIKEKLDELSK